MTPAELTKALSAAMPGDVLSIPAGSYGAVTVSRPGLTVSADPEARFDRLTFAGCAEVAWSGGRVLIPSVDATVSSTPAVRFVNCKRVAFRGAAITGAIATSGAAETVDTTANRPGDNIIGWPTGRGVSIEFSDSVEVSGCEIAQVHKGIVLSRSPRCRIADNHVHHVRTSCIVGDAPDGTVICANNLHDSNPWKYGGTGDHGDFIHLWTPAGMGLTAPTTGVEITGNLIREGEGTPLLAIFLEDNSKCGFTGVKIAGNTVLNGNAQGIALTHVDGDISGNLLLQTSGTVKTAPTLLERPDCTLRFTGNRLADVYGIAAKYPENEWLAAGVRPPAEIDAARNTALKALGIIPPDPRDVALADAVARIAALTAELSAANDNRDAAKAEAETLKLRLGAIYTMAAP